MNYLDPRVRGIKWSLLRNTEISDPEGRGIKPHLLAPCSARAATQRRCAKAERKGGLKCLDARQNRQERLVVGCLLVAFNAVGMCLNLRNGAFYEARVLRCASCSGNPACL